MSYEIVKEPYMFINNYKLNNKYYYNQNTKMRLPPRIYSKNNCTGYQRGKNSLWRRREKVICNNCYKIGHYYENCKNYIDSFGIIALRRKNADAITLEQSNNFGIVKDRYPCNLRMLFVQRKDTMGYVEFVRGRYPNNEPKRSEQLKIFFGEMIPEELERLCNSTFDEIWDLLWVNHNSRSYKQEREYSRNKFNTIDVERFLDYHDIRPKWKTTEFGIPKGRRCSNEINRKCAEREFQEETGYGKKDYRLLSNNPYIEETFIGTNKKKYRHIYYLAEVFDDAGGPVIDENDKNQIGEIKNVVWLTKSESLQVIRDYDTEKIKVIEEVFKNFKNFKRQWVLNTF